MKKRWILLLVIFLILVSFLIVKWLNIFVPGGEPEPTLNLTSADYYVIGSAGSYTVKNNSGETITSGSNAATVINYVLSKMKSGQKVAFQGTFSVLDRLLPKSNTTMLFGSSEITADASIPKTHGFSVLIILDYLSNVTIDGGFFHGNGCQWAIEGYSSSSCTVQNAYFEGFVGSFPGGVVEFADGNSHLIQNCTFENYGSDYNFRFNAVALNGCSNSRILHNYADCGNKAAGFGAWSQGQGGNEIAFNTVKNWSNMFNHCIYIGGTPGTTIHDNECTSPVTALGGAIAIKCRADVYNNHVYNTPAWGITIYWVEGGGDYGDPAGSRIYNNTIENALDGALVISPRTGTSGPVRDIKFFNNTCSGNWPGNRAAGIFIVDIDYDTYNITFQDNKISNMTYGVRFGGGGLETNEIKFLRNTFTSISYPFVVQEAVNTTIAYNILDPANAITMLQDSGINTMIYDNVPLGALPDKNVPQNKIPQPPSPP